jgi:hypothetical protein
VESSRQPVRLSIAITTVPERADYLAQLLAWLGPVEPAPEIFSDAGHRGPWWNTRRAWLATPEWATHRLVLQDDIKPCGDFVETATRVLAAQGESFVSFIMSMPALLDYMQQGVRYMPYLGAYGQAACLPAAWAREFVEWADDVDFDALPDMFFVQARLPDRQPHDDGLLMHWLYEEDRAACATVPALVLHRGRDESTLGHKGRYQDGRVPLLVKGVLQGVVQAAPGWYWIGEGKSGLDLDWTQGGTACA